MFHMKTASIRDVRQHFNRILEWVADGEEVAITRRRQPVARLLPITRQQTVRQPMPDVNARLRKVFGKKMIPATVMATILDENRRAW
jgi:prevent-host-death family protein